jgi:CHAT domain-containing protein/Tfp pilus assembly protein PilF
MKLLILTLLCTLFTRVPTVLAQQRNIAVDTTLAGRYYWQAMELQKIRKYDSSNVLLNKAVLLYEKHQQWKKKLDTENNLLFNLILLGQYNKALQQAQQISAETINKLSKESTTEADTYHNLGILYTIQGEYDKALEYHQKTLQLRIKTLSEAHPDVAKSYNNLGILYNIKGEYEQALEYHQKALQVRVKSLGVSHPDVATSYNNLGIVYAEKGDNNKAIEYYLNALKIYRKNLGDFHPDVAKSNNNIGVVYEDKGEYNKALHFYQEALHIYNRAFIASNPDIARTYNNIASVYERQGEYTKSLSSYQQAIMANVPTFQDTLVDHNPHLANQTRIYLDGGGALTSLLGKGRVLTKLLPASTHQHLLLAYQALCLADTLIGQVLNSFSSEQDKVTFLAEASQAYQQALLVCQQLYQLTGNNTYLDHAFYFAGRGKASLLASTIAESKAKSFAGIADSLLAKDEYLQVEVARLEQQVAQELTHSNALNNIKLTEYQNSLFLAHRQQDSLVTHFERQYPKYYELKYKTTTVTIQQLQQQLDSKTAVVEYVVGDSTLHALTLTHYSFDIQTQRIDSSFHRQITAFRNSMYLQQQDVYEDVALKLYQKLWPKNLSSKVKQVIIIPDGMLATIPFEALLIPAHGKKHKPAYVLEKYTISYAYSASLLYENLIRPTLNKNRHLLAVAPVFANTVTSTTATKHLIEEYNRSFASASSTDQDASDAGDITANISTFLKRGYLLDGSYVPPLPASEKEVQALDQLFKANKGYTKAYLHSQAKEEVLKSKEFSSYNYVHLATHGFVNASRPELSGLLLAQDSTSQEDGILYAGEIYNLYLQAELVCLSACETGLGKLAKGEGIIGLTRALLYAGASNVAVSLWKVADESTSELMQAFYKRMLAGESKAKALQGAKLSLLANKQYAHPYFWAPFILIGR